MFYKVVPYSVEGAWQKRFFLIRSLLFEKIDFSSFLGRFSEITFFEVLDRSFVRCGFFYSKVGNFWSRMKKKIKFFDHRKLEKNDFEISRCFHVEILNFMILY